MKSSDRPYVNAYGKLVIPPSMTAHKCIHESSYDRIDREAMEMAKVRTQQFNENVRIWNKLNYVIDQLEQSCAS